MKWYNYIACFFAGVFLVNSIPHFIHCISGNFFPTPFADPPGKGLSHPLLNLIWAYFNIVIGYLLFRAGKMQKPDKWALVLFITGFIAMSFELSRALVDKM